MSDILKLDAEARAIKAKLDATDNMCEISELIDSMSEDVAKWVLRLYVYAKED